CRCKTAKRGRAVPGGSYRSAGFPAISTRDQSPVCIADSWADTVAGLHYNRAPSRNVSLERAQSLFSPTCLSCSILTSDRVVAGEVPSPYPLPRVGAEGSEGGERAMEILIPAERIQARVTELARQIGVDYHDRPITIVGVLTGSLIFLA